MENNSNPISEISDICSAFFENIEDHDLLNKILRTAISITNGERGTIFLVHRDKVKKDLFSFVATGLNGQKIQVGANEGVVGHIYKTKKPIIVNDAPNDPRFFSQIDKETHFKTKNILGAPILTPEGHDLGVIEILNSKNGRFSPTDLEYLRLISFFAGVALGQQKKVLSLVETNQILKQNQQMLIEDKNKNCLLNSKSPAFNSMLKKIPLFASSDISILIQGESGTGKEVMARDIHLKSPRAGSPFVALNCSAIPESLFEAELFGVAKGAATGVVEKKGKIELANDGTLFLDEIGDLPLAMQSKLLRVLQEKEITRIGSEAQPQAVDFRLIAATNKNLEEMIKKETFREDLYYRLQGAHLHLPSIRERLEDLPDLCSFIVQKICSDKKIPLKSISADVMNLLGEQAWPGNIRQLENKLELAVIMSEERAELKVRDFDLNTALQSRRELQTPSSSNVISLKTAKQNLERSLVESALVSSSGNKSKAARILGITRQGLEKAIQRLKISA